jgi:hypothetical protein
VPSSLARIDGVFGIILISGSPLSVGILGGRSGGFKFGAEDERCTIGGRVIMGWDFNATAPEPAGRGRIDRDREAAGRSSRIEDCIVPERKGRVGARDLRGGDSVSLARC